MGTDEDETIIQIRNLLNYYVSCCKPPNKDEIKSAWEVLESLIGSNAES